MKKHVEPNFDFLNIRHPEAKKILEENRIALTPDEARYFQQKLNRPLTLTELTIFGIQGSEHCSYRSTRQQLKKLPTRGKNVILGPGEDAGIINIAQEKNGKKWGLVIGHESHNHPSQIVPFEGAATGVGGIVRDILCMGARVIGCLDCLRFGKISKHSNRWIAREVIKGIAGYGNPLGVPNIGGDIEFNPSFDSNCLVNVIAIGVVRDNEIIHSFVPQEAAHEKWDIIVVGKPSDQSGFGGASFASANLRKEDTETNKGAVQEPNPFLERHLLVTTYDLFEKLKQKKLLGKVSFKDMGAGGNVCASVEQLDQQNLGAEIHVEKIHTSNSKLPPHIIACSETQERFCWICHPKVTKLILDTYNKKWALPDASVGAQASVVGKVRHGNYILKFHNTKIVDAPAKLLTEGLVYDRAWKTKIQKLSRKKVNLTKIDLVKTLQKLLASENISSRKPVFEKYDKQVQGGTILDAGGGANAIIRPLINTSAPKNLQKIGITVGTGGSSSLGRFSASLQSQHAICEAVANTVITGAKPLALTDCLNYGNPEKVDQMREFVSGIEGLQKTAEALSLPFVSGNVSLYNNNGVSSINPSALVSCIGKLENADDFTPQKFQKAGNYLVLIGNRSDYLGGSELEKIIGKKLGNTFEINSKQFSREIKLILKVKKLMKSARDLHRGGLVIASLESSFGSNLGIELKNLGKKLFSENPGFLLEIEVKDFEKLKIIAKKLNVKIMKVGKTLEEEKIKIGKFEASISTLEKIWEESFRKVLQS